MNSLVTATSLVLFALLYEMSGGAEFTPAPAVVREEARPPSVFAKDFIPFDQPVIISAQPTVGEAQVRAAQVTDIVQASFTTDSNPANDPREDIRAISGARVNLRAGPSTDFDIVGSATRGSEVALLEVTAEDWAHVRLLETDQAVWVAAWLLSD